MTRNTRAEAKRQIIPEIPTTLPDDLPIPSTSRNLLPRSRTTSLARSASRSLPSSRGSSRRSSVSSILANNAPLPQSVLSDSQPRTPASGGGTSAVQSGSNETSAVLPTNLSREEQFSGPPSNPASNHSQHPTQPLASTSQTMNPLFNVAGPSGSQHPTLRRDDTRAVLEENGWPRRFSFNHMGSYIPHTDSEDELGVWSANPPGGMRLISNDAQPFNPLTTRNPPTSEEGSSHMQSSSSFNGFSQLDFSGTATDQGTNHFSQNMRDVEWEHPRLIAQDHDIVAAQQNNGMNGLGGEPEVDTSSRSTSDMFLSSGWGWDDGAQRHVFNSTSFQLSEGPSTADLTPANQWALPFGSPSQVASSSNAGGSGKRKRQASPSQDREQEEGGEGTRASTTDVPRNENEESQQTGQAERESDDDGEVTRQLLPSDETEASPSGSRSLQTSPITPRNRKSKGKGKARAQEPENTQSVIDMTNSPPINRQQQNSTPAARPDSTMGQNTSNDTASATKSSNPKPSGDPLSSYTCPICFSPPTNATLTPCGHICCGECLFAAVKTTLNRSGMAALGARGLIEARCPVCRATIPGWDGKGGGVIGLKVRAVFSL